MEINHPVAQRQQVVKLIDELVSTKLATFEPAPTYEEIITTFPDAFIDALNLFNDEARDSDADIMAAQLTRLERARRALRPFANLRPFAEERAQLKVLDQLSKWWPIYRQAITNVNLDFVYEKLREGQSTVDSSMDAIREIRPTLDALAVLDDYDSEPSLTMRQIRALEIRYPETPIYELDPIGAHRVSETLGLECPPGLGLQHFMLEMLAEGAFLPNRFVDKVQEVNSLWQKHSQRISEVAAMERAVDDFAGMATYLTEAFLDFDNAVKRTTHRRGIIRAADRLLGRVYEDSQPMWTWNVLLLGTSVAPEKYKKTTQLNSTDHVRKLEKVLPLVCQDAVISHRHASQHGTSVQPDDAGENVTIITKSGGEEVLTTEEYIDRLYALVESVIAMYWVAQLSLASYDVNPQSHNDMPSGFGMTVTDEAFLLLEARLGLTVYRNEIIDGVWHIEADTSNDSLLPIAGYLSTYAKPDAKALDFRRPGYQGALHHVSSTYLQDLLSGQTEQNVTEDQRVINLLKHLSAISFEGQAALTSNDLRWAATKLGIRLLDDKSNFTTQKPLLWMVKDWAEQRDLHDVVENILSIARVSRRNDFAEKYKKLEELKSSFKKLFEPPMPELAGVRIDATHPSNGSTPFFNLPSIPHKVNEIRS